MFVHFNVDCTESSKDIVSQVTEDSFLFNKQQQDSAC
jgi:hypothetical protein